MIFYQPDPSGDEFSSFFHLLQRLVHVHDARLHVVLDDDLLQRIGRPVRVFGGDRRHLLAENGVLDELAQPARVVVRVPVS